MGTRIKDDTRTSCRPATCRFTRFAAQPSRASRNRGGLISIAVGLRRGFFPLLHTESVSSKFCIQIPAPVSPSDPVRRDSSR